MKLILTTDDGTPLGEVTGVERFGDMGLEESRPGSYRMTQSLTFVVAKMIYHAPDVPTPVKTAGHQSPAVNLGDVIPPSGGTNVTPFARKKPG